MINLKVVNNVHNIKPDAPKPTVIILLERLLEQAKAGKVTDLVAYVRSDGFDQFEMATDNFSTLELIGAFSIMHNILMQSTVDECEIVDDAS
jgi:hypothetical protein